jgi:hypothetical protein
MSRRSFDDGHQNQAHTSGFNLNFPEIHNLFHGHREVISDVARDEGISFDEANDLGDLVDPQNDTYEEEGTHGPALVVGAAAKAAAKGYMAARSNPKTGPMVKAGEEAVKEKGKEIAGKAMGTLKDKLKGKGGAGLASPDSEGVGTPDSDDPLA